MSDLRGRRSPYEQGELKPSPQRHSKKKKSSKKSKKSHRLPPEAKLHVHKADEDDDIQIIEAVGHGEEEGGSLTIKPPQTQASKLDKIHKRKKDKRKPRSNPTATRDHSFNPGQKRDVRDAREIVRERKKERELKEKEVAREISKREARKREESTKERERLERMVLEQRRRERQAREDHEKEKEQRQQKRKEGRRQLLEHQFNNSGLEWTSVDSSGVEEELDMTSKEPSGGSYEDEDSGPLAAPHPFNPECPPSLKFLTDGGKWTRKSCYDFMSPDTQREKIRGEGRPSGDNFRSRSRDNEKNKDKFHQFSPQTRNSIPEVKKESSKGDLPLGKSLSKDLADKALADSDQDTRRVVVDSGGDSSLPVKKKDRTRESKEGDKEAIERIHHSPHDLEKTKESGKKEEEEEEDDEMGENDSEGDSDSDSDSSDSDSSSEEEEEDSSEEEEDEEEEEEVMEGQKISQRSGRHEAVDRTDDGRAKLRSKFDDHSDIESPAHHSEQSRSEDEYLPESPEMSDVEDSLEDSLPFYLPAIQGCRSVEEFNCLNRIEEGTYGVVYRALDKKTNEIVALKRLKMEKEKEGFPITSLREINTLLKAQHENIVTVREIVVGNNMDKIYIVMDFVEHDLKTLMENMKNPFLVGEVKTLLQQLLRAVRHLHDNWILHRDLKTSNLLLSHKGILKVGDFGLAREYGSPLRKYTPVVVTLWYRAPELLLGCKEYSTLVDMWSVGCIFAEFLLMKALWPGKSEIDQINRIFKDLGTPTEKIWPGVMELPGMKKVNFNENPYNVIRNRFGSYFTDSGFDLMNRFFAYDPKKRVTADDALKHEYFGESPLPVDPSMFPTWPARSEQTKKSVSSPKPPSGGKAYQKLMDEEENITAGGFHMPSAGKGVMAFSLKF